MPEPTHKPSGERVTRSDILRDLHALGLLPGTFVLVHASLSRIGSVDGGAETVVDALVEAVGPEGIVLFPAHTGHAGISPDNPPDFDVRTAPTLNVGVIPEAARLRPEARRSLQPTHSVSAIGKDAAAWTEGHEYCTTPCGIGSPYEKLCRSGGMILLLGCTHQANTTLHMVEEMAGLPYHLLPGSGRMRIIDREGTVHRLPGRFHRWGVPRDFMRLDTEMTRRGIQRIGSIGQAESRLVDAGPMAAFFLERLREDPSILLPADYRLPQDLQDD